MPEAIYVGAAKITVPHPVLNRTKECDAPKRLQRAGKRVRGIYDI